MTQADPLVRAAALCVFFCGAALAAPVRIAPPPDIRAQARDLERRLDDLERRFREMDRKLMRESLEVLHVDAVLSRYPPGSKEAEEAESRAKDILDEAKREAPLILEMTVLSRRLQTYRETGTLPAGIPDLYAVRRLLEKPWTERTETPMSERELPALMRQLLRYDELSGRPPRLEAAWVLPSASTLPAKGRGAALPQAPRPPERTSAAAPAAALERGAGRGREHYDPVPALIGLLSSKVPLSRALAADELGRRGAAAASAVPALRAALGDPDAGVRSSAVLALGGIGGLPAEVVAEVRRALLDRDEDVRFSARVALRRLGATR
ncbi:MAG: HEAT repeat domain-containing protein [Elusimicrobiota bacterium]